MSVSSPLRACAARCRSLIDITRLGRFGLSGVASTLFYFAVTNLLVLANAAEPVVASVWGYLLSIALSYWMQSRFTFRMRGDSTKRVASFVAASLGGLLVSYLVMRMAHDVMGLSYVVGTIAVCILIPALNYMIMSLIIFKKA